MKSYFVILILIPTILALKDIGQLNVIRVESADNDYNKLFLGDDGFLSAPPMVVLDSEKFKTYQCFKNIRSNRWSIGIPIIFWNQTYMDRITATIKSIQFFKKYHPNISELVLPPCGILAYRLNWRRRYQLFEDNSVILDSFWYTGNRKYVLPKFHNFVMEFKADNDTDDMCNLTKEKILNQTMQRQELSIDFVVKKLKKETIPSVKITVSDIRATNLFNDTKCENKDKCFVTHEYAEKWSYDISANVLKTLNIIHLSLQKEIFDKVLNDYLCKNKASMAEIGSIVIKRILQNSNNEMGCSIPEKVFTTLKNVCTQELVNYPYRRYENKCTNEALDYSDEIVIKLDPAFDYNEKNEFTITVKS